MRKLETGHRAAEAQQRGAVEKGSLEGRGKPGKVGGWGLSESKQVKGPSGWKVRLLSIHFGSTTIDSMMTCHGFEQTPQLYGTCDDLGVHGRTDLTMATSMTKLDNGRRPSLLREISFSTPLDSFSSLPQS